MVIKACRRRKKGGSEGFDGRLGGRMSRNAVCSRRKTRSRLQLAARASRHARIDEAQDDDEAVNECLKVYRVKRCSRI